ncbi:MAG: rubrerythrin family protein, partial [Desulfurococcaceae archaeon]
VAFAASIAISVLLTALFTYYSSTIEDRDFKKEFAESIGLLLGIALASYLLGEVLGGYFEALKSV